MLLYPSDVIVLRDDTLSYDVAFSLGSELFWEPIAKFLCRSQLYYLNKKMNIPMFVSDSLAKEKFSIIWFTQFFISSLVFAALSWRSFVRNEFLINEIFRYHHKQQYFLALWHCFVKVFITCCCTRYIVIQFSTKICVALQTSHVYGEIIAIWALFLFYGFFCALFVFIMVLITYRTCVHSNFIIPKSSKLFK